MKKHKILVMSITGAIMLYTVIGFFLLPYMLTRMLPETLSEKLHREVDMQHIRFNPYTLQASIEGLTIREPGTNDVFVSFTGAGVNLKWISLIKLAPVMSELNIDQPFVAIIRNEDGTFNFSDLLNGGSGPDSKPFSYHLSNIRINNGRLNFDDRMVEKLHKARDINIAIPFISNIEAYTEIIVQPSFQATVDGTRLAFQGRAKPFSATLESIVDVTVNQLNLPDYLAYLPARSGLSISSGKLDLDFVFAFRHAGSEHKPEINLSGELVCRDLALVDKNAAPLTRIKDITVTLAPSFPVEKKIHITKISINAPELEVRRDRRGDFNLLTAFGADPGNGDAKPHKMKEEPSTAATPFDLSIDAIELSQGTLRYTDVSGDAPFTLTGDGLELRADSITTAQTGTGNIDMQCNLNRLGHMALRTSFTIQPLTAKIEYDLQGLQPAWVQPYFFERVPILIRQGALASRGKVLLSRKDDEPARLHFTGNARVRDFACIDRAHARDFVAWQNLAFQDIDFTNSPLRLQIAGISLVKPSVSLIIREGGKTNVSGILQSEDRKAGSAAKPAQSGAANISIGRISCSDGRFIVKDESIKPNYTSSLIGITGNITGLTSEAFKKAEVNLQAKQNNHSPVRITGSINPLEQDLFVDLLMRLDNVELSSFTPYSGKYLGYALEKGKLSLGLNYFIDQQVLKAENDVHIDQLTFGEAVESKDATKLPVQLAVALLRDNDGRITLQLPVTGRLDDPDFHVGKIIVQALVNILQKAAASPFALLEAIYPGSSELNEIGFDPGTSALTRQAVDKLGRLVEILSERPGLKLEISAYTDIQNDTKGLKAALFERSLKEEKIKDLLRRGKQAPSLDEMVLDDKEYKTYLAKAYDALESPGTPRAAELSEPDMRKVLEDAVAVSFDDLEKLCADRSQAIRDYLVGEGGIDSARIFLIQAQTADADTSNTGKALLKIK